MESLKAIDDQHGFGKPSIWNGGYSVRNVFDFAPSMWQFHDASGKFGQDEWVVICNVYCDEQFVAGVVTDLDILAFENEVEKPLHYAELPSRFDGRFSQDARCAKSWLMWFVTSGHRHVRIGVRAIRANSPKLWQDSLNRGWVAYNRQASCGVLFDLACFCGELDAIKLRGFVDSEASYLDLPVQGGPTGDNFPSYLPNKIAFKTCVKRSEGRRYPEVLVADTKFEVIARTARYHVGSSEYRAWRLLQFADLIAGSVRQAITGRATTGVKRTLGLLGGLILQMPHLAKARAIGFVEPDRALYKSAPHGQLPGLDLEMFVNLLSDEASEICARMNQEEDVR